VRPACCGACGAASRPAGGGIVLQGHGRRERQVWGPATADGKPEMRSTWVRRFLCKRCKATMTVAPGEVLTKRLYSGPAIALAFALFALAGLALHEVRRRVSPWAAVVGFNAAAGWASVPRWAKAVQEGRLFQVRCPPRDWRIRSSNCVDLRFEVADTGRVPTVGARAMTANRLATLRQASTFRERLGGTRFRQIFAAPRASQASRANWLVRVQALGSPAMMEADKRGPSGKRRAPVLAFHCHQRRGRAPLSAESACTRAPPQAEKLS
jgi:hypothetical protein